MFKIIRNLLLLATASLPLCAQTNDVAREHIRMDADWRFALGHACDTQKDFNYSTVPFFFAKAGYGDGPASPKFDDRTWRILDLPHDWAVELPFDQRGTENHGSKAIGLNFPENSVGWYRKTFTVPKEDLGKRIEIEFDGVYRDSAVWVNGFQLGVEHSGYSSFHYDMTDYLNYGGPNVIAVRANATVEEGWFYEGAGIYRHVWLTKTAPLHVAHDGTFVTTTVTDPLAAHPDANVTATATIQNDGDQAARFTVEEQIKDADGKVIASATGAADSLPAREGHDLSVTMPVHDARLWSIEKPYLHTLTTIVRMDGNVVDSYTTKFGIRTIRFDPNEGFFLNGKHVELKGTADHQDHAGVGIAIPDTLNEFRVQRLKEMGSNAIRTAHNPPTPELLDVCDRLGMLVIDENRMMGTTPELYDRLESLILRDRNHPSIILWSVGNEEWALENSVYGERLTREMQAFVKRLDPTRRSTVALSSSGRGDSLTTEVLGFNYYIQHDIDAMHKRFPDRPVVGTEESASPHTRGIYVDDPQHQHLVAYDYEKTAQHASVEDAWRFHVARPFSSGLFYWTGFDYRGETSPFAWPAISSPTGLLDTCGFFKDNAFLVQSWWTEKPMVHLLPHWNWPGREGQPIDVRVYSNAAAIELFLNGKSLGRKPMPENSHLEWKVLYEPGQLRAVGSNSGGSEIAMDAVETTTAPAKVELIPNQARIEADGMAVSVITVQVRDAKNRVVPDAGNLISFGVKGPGRIIGVGNGDPSSHEADRYIEKVRSIKVAEWRTLAIDSKPSDAEIAANFDDSSWEKARDTRWNEKRIDPPTSVFRGSFDLGGAENDAKVKLVLRGVGATQSIYINGHLLGQDLPFEATGYEYVLEPGVLLPGRNVVAIVATRFSDQQKKAQLFQWDVAGPAAVQVVTPPPAWKRSVFNGLAQVIVQSTAEAGAIELTGSSSGLAPATISILTARP
jgi:beta-galactosidase